jgi:hypothetical protein
MVTVATVRTLALALPGCEEGTSFGTLAFKVGGRLFARLREEGDVLVVKAGSGHREALIQSRPDVYHVTPHYLNYPYVLVRLATVDEVELDDLLADAWSMVAPKRLVARCTAEPAEPAEPRENASQARAAPAAMPAQRC